MVQCCNSSLSKVACTPFSLAAGTSSSSFQGKTKVSHHYSEVTKSHPCQTLTPSELTLGFGEDYIPKLSSLKQHYQTSGAQS